MRSKKISLIGSGNIGGTLAHLFAMKELGDVMFDQLSNLFNKEKKRVLN